MIDRRGFLRAAFAAAVAIHVDPKAFVEAVATPLENVIPKATVLSECEVIAIELEKITHYIRTLFDREDYFYYLLSGKPADIITTRPMRVPLEIRPGGEFGRY